MAVSKPTHPRRLGSHPQETSPLLHDNDDNASDDELLLSPPAPHPHYLKVVVIVTVTVFLIEVGDYLTRAPITRLLEDIVCRHYYDSLESLPIGIDITKPIPEENCKIPAIQSKLAEIRGWDVTFSCLPGIVLAIPFGMLADKYGRKLVLLITLTGITLASAWQILFFNFSDSFNVKWIWAANAFMLIGGGPVVLKSMWYAMISDVASEEQRAAIFFRVTGIGLLSTLIGVPTAWLLSRTDPMLAMWLGLAFVSIILPLSLLIPETLIRTKTADSEIEDENIRPISSSLNLKERLQAFVANTKETHFIFKSPIIIALVVPFFCQSLSGRMSELLYQLASERFHWKLTEASFLIPIGAVTNFVVLIIALPIIYHFLTTRYHMTSMVKDLIVTRGSLVFLTLGCIVISWAPLPGMYILGTIIFNSGAGFAPALRSLVTSLVHPDEVSRLYAILAVADVLGQMFTGPILARGYGWGMQLGGYWTGMAFNIAAFMFLACMIPLWLLKKPTRSMDVHR